MSAKVATLHQMQTVYSVEDVMDLLEVYNVDAYNNRIYNKWASKNGGA